MTKTNVSVAVLTVFAYVREYYVCSRICTNGDSAINIYHKMFVICKPSVQKKKKMLNFFDQKIVRFQATLRLITYLTVFYYQFCITRAYYCFIFLQTYKTNINE